VGKTLAEPRREQREIFLCTHREHSSSAVTFDDQDFIFLSRRHSLRAGHNTEWFILELPRLWKPAAEPEMALDF